MPTAERVVAFLLVVPFLMGAATAKPAGTGTVEFTFRDPEIVESSGLAVTGGLVLTINDSGDVGRVFAVDPSNGRTVGVTRWSPEPSDVEAVAVAPDGSAWVGDIGDNEADRDSVQLLNVPVARRDQTVTPTTYDLTYPDGARDAEAVLVDPVTGRVYVAAKSIFGGSLFAAPETVVTAGKGGTGGTGTLEPVGPIASLVTDGAFFPDGKHLVLRDYSRAYVYTFPGLERVGDFALPKQAQGEGLAVEADGTMLVSTEGQFTDVLRVDVPARIRDVVTPAPTPSAAPTRDPNTVSREGSELPVVTTIDRPAWPWFLTGWLAVGVLVLVLRWTYKRH